MSAKVPVLPSDVVRILRRLDFVRWDRFEERDGYLTIYGWIPVDDETRDFVVLLEDAEGLDYVTSSAKWSGKIGAILAGEVIDEAPESQRVEHHVPEELDNVVRERARRQELDQARTWWRGLEAARIEQIHRVLMAAAGELSTSGAGFGFAVLSFDQQTGEPYTLKCEESDELVAQAFTLWLDEHQPEWVEKIAAKAQQITEEKNALVTR